MFIYSSSEARVYWSTILDRVKNNKETIFISKHGEVIAAIMPIDEFKAGKNSTKKTDKNQ